jgi:ribonuclease D
LPEIIQTPDALDAAVRALRDAPAIALDTETDAYFAYRPSVCLIQVSAPDRDFLVDPLSGIDLAPLGDLCADPARELVFHAAENDVILLKHQFGWKFGRLYDTQVALFVLGLPPYSLQGVLESRFGVRLDKKMQRSDWSLRPLRKEQIEYAAEDTRHLLKLAVDLKRSAAEAGRTEEIESECRRIALREWTPEPFDPEGFWKIAGAKELDGIGLRILHDLYLFRHGEADARNRAPYRIFGDDVMIAVARQRATSQRPGIPAGIWARFGRQIAPLVEKAREKGPLPKRHVPRDRGEPPPPDVFDRYERLRRWRTETARKRGVEPFVVARNELLFQLAVAFPRTLGELEPLLEPFRLREYGDAILDSMRGAAENRGS